MQIKYRPEIDGLRTIAVLSVIIYHAEFYGGRFFKGGFLGVDIFFVISGFLITSLILREREKSGKFSITRFYERRARRLLPALFIVMLASLPLAWIYLLPDQLVDFAKSIIASLFFVSNFYWDSSLQEYGAESAFLKPFLHTWSLAVEEQFYILYPLILMAVFKWFRKFLLPILGLGFLGSLVFAEIAVSQNPSFTFYMLPSRFWELLAGGLLASFVFQRSPDAKPYSNIARATLPLLGILLIIFSVIFTSFTDNHPGLVTLPSVIGTVLIIWFANKKDIVTRILSTRLFVGIGLISYSLYLWHYPIFAFGRIRDVDPSIADKILWIAATFILSILTFFLVERPFRNRVKISLMPLILSIVLVGGGVAGVSYYWIKNDGFKARLGYLETVLQPAKRIWVTQEGEKCHSGAPGKRKFSDVFESCVFEFNSGAKYIAIVGDSHAGSLSEKLKKMAQLNQMNFIQITRGGCPHIGGSGSKYCKDRADEIVTFLKDYPNTTIVYNARIPLFIEQSRFDNEEGGKETDYKAPNMEKVRSEYASRSQMIFETFESWQQAGHELVLIYPVPEQGFDVGKKLFSMRPIIENENMLPDLSTDYDVFKRRMKRSYETLDRVEGSGVKRVYPENLFCDDAVNRCFASRGKEIYFGTDHHVSPLGATLIVNEVAEKLSVDALPN